MRFIYWRRVTRLRRTDMKNVEISVQGEILTIKVDLTKSFGPSCSGKAIIIASSEGNAKVPDHSNVQFGINVFTKGGK